MDGIKKQLDDDGMAVFPDVLSPGFCDDIVSQYQEWWATFGERGPDNLGSMLLKYGCPHLDATWKVRLAVKSVFAYLWGTEKLLTSFDGLSVGQPGKYNAEPKADKFYKEGEALGLHLDHGPERVGLHAYQGSVFLERAEEDDYCFRVLTRSHKYTEELYTIYPFDRPFEFKDLSDEEVEWFLSKGCEYKRISVPKGGVLVWDSRLVHDGARPKIDRKHPERWRRVNFVSMTPAIWASQSDLEVKRQAMESLKPTTHWSSQSCAMFPDFPKYPGVDLEVLPEIAKTEEVQRLAGLLKYNFNDGVCNGPDWIPKWKNDKNMS